MKTIKYSLLLLSLLFVQSIFAAPHRVDSPAKEDLTNVLQEMDLEEYLSMTPKKYKKKYGKKLGIKNTIHMKMTQKLIKRNMKKADAEKRASDDLSKGLYILLAFLGLGWLAMGLLDDFDGSNWIICLVLYLLLWLPGFIYTLVKMSDYY